MNGAEQDRRDELASLYALGVITGSELAELQAEMQTSPEFAESIRGLTRVSVGLTQAVPLVDPPLALRSRVLTSVTGKRFGPAAIVEPGGGKTVYVGPDAIPPAPKVLKATTRAWPGYLAAAAAILVAVAAGSYALQLQGRVDRVEQELAQATTRATQAQQDLVSLRRALSDAQVQTQSLRLEAAVFMAPDVNKVDLAGQPVAPGASARAFWSRSRGVVFAANNLPALPAGKTYQLWFVPGNAAPVSAGLITPDATGAATVHFITPPTTPEKIAAMAVTLEPEGGVPAPTGDKYLVGLANF
jgi:anti-sigma-K factor RskA